jgi:cyclopropane fatty-acyl-phospholipid synthase-like methyltransferase
MHAFDLTARMLERFRVTLETRGVEGVHLAEADVLHLNELPASWGHYDLIVSASMLEYVPPMSLVTALSGLRSLMNENSSFLLFITRRNLITRPLIGQWWQSNLYKANELDQSFREAGFTHIMFRHFTPLFRYLAPWGYIIEARK